MHDQLPPKVISIVILGKAIKNIAKQQTLSFILNYPIFTMEELVHQQLIDQDRGADILRNQINTDTSLRQQFESVFNRPLTPAEQFLLSNPPDYSAQEIASDAETLKYQCPILLAFPQKHTLILSWKAR